MRRQDISVQAEAGSQLSAVNRGTEALVTARRALAAGDVRKAARALQTGLLTDRPSFMKIASTDICQLVWLSERCGQPIEGLTATDLQKPLEQAVEKNDVRALFALGRALCAIACGPNAARMLVTRRDMRRGVALLVRAASAGCAEAWLHLYAVTANGPASVNNAKMARFCRSKAAAAGLLQASR